MEGASNSPSGAGSANWVWIPVLAVVVLCWPLICCCCIVLVALALILGPIPSNVSGAPIPVTIPPVVTVPAIPIGLDPEAEPLFGSVRLQRGFSPDPYLVEAVAGGTVDTSRLEQDCGFTSSPPAFSFQLSGGASETFLRIFFTADDGTATTLLVHTPDGEWLCETGSPTGYGSGDDPLIDLQFAPSGEYDIWAGTREDVTPVAGTLSITQSVDVTP